MGFSSVPSLAEQFVFLFPLQFMAWLGFFVRKDKIPMRLSCGGGGTLHSFQNFVLYV
ncbi:hypothetical protein ASPFODRAFT_43890, partial [Aspergillus luchuensis CBS 106.47]